MNLKEHFSYDPDTGVITALSNRGRVRKGMELGSKTVAGYLTVSLNGKSYLCHRLAFFLINDAWPVNDVDHINGDRSDNRWCNLRQATRQQNLFNKLGNKAKTLPRNVYPHKSGRFRVKMKIDGLTRHFGYYSSVEEAADKANQIRKLFHGEYAKEI